MLSERMTFCLPWFVTAAVINRSWKGIAVLIDIYDLPLPQAVVVKTSLHGLDLTVFRVSYSKNFSDSVLIQETREWKDVVA